MIHAMVRCEHLAERLEHLEGSRLRQHSVFDRAANYRADDGHIVTFLPKDTPMAVDSVRLPIGQIRQRFEGEREFLVEDGRLIGRGFAIGFDAAQGVDPTIRRIAPDVLSGRLGQIRAALIETIPQYGAFSDIAAIPALHLSPGAVEGRGTHRYRAFVDGLFQRAWDPSLAQAVHHLIGYGFGLTPSADDFLSGVLAALSDEPDWFTSLAQACRADLARTTDISAEMLYHASEKRFSQSIIGLLDGSFPARAIAALLDHGHSSGHDTLCGIYTGLTARAGWQDKAPASR